MPDERTPKERIRDAKQALRRIEQREAPTATELAAAPRLTAWFVIDLNGISALGGTVKLTLLRQQAVSCIEIDLSGVPLVASADVIRDAVINSADRYWLNNAKLAAAKEAALKGWTEEERRRHQALVLKHRNRALAAWRAASKQKPGSAVEEACQHSLARIERAGLDEVLVEGLGSCVWFQAPSRLWQAPLIEHLVIETAASSVPHVPDLRAAFTTKRIVHLLLEKSLLKSAARLWLDQTTIHACKAAASDYVAPQEVVELYLSNLQSRGVVERSGSVPDGWHLSLHLVRQAGRRLQDPAAGAERLAQIRMRVLRLVTLAEVTPFDVDAWMRAEHAGLQMTPKAATIEGGDSYRILKAILDGLERMLRPRSLPEPRLIGLPLGHVLEKCRREYDQLVRERQEAVRQKEQRKAETRRDRLIQRAQVLLGVSDGKRWTATPIPQLGNMVLVEVDGLSEQEEAQIEHLLNSHASTVTATVTHASATNHNPAPETKPSPRPDLVEELSRHARTWFGDDNSADFWVGAMNSRLGGCRPKELCVDRNGLAACLAVLFQERHRA